MNTETKIFWYEPFEINRKQFERIKNRFDGCFFWRESGENFLVKAATKKFFKLIKSHIK